MESHSNIEGEKSHEIERLDLRANIKTAFESGLLDECITAVIRAEGCSHFTKKLAMLVRTAVELTTEKHKEINGRKTKRPDSDEIEQLIIEQVLTSDEIAQSFFDHYVVKLMDGMPLHTIKEKFGYKLPKLLEDIERQRADKEWREYRRRSDNFRSRLLAAEIIGTVRRPSDHGSVPRGGYIEPYGRPHDVGRYRMRLPFPDIWD